MQRTLLALALAAATPALAQIEFSEEPGATTCGAFTAMDSAARQQALVGVEPVGGELVGAGPAIARQWSDAVAAACAGHPERPLADAAAQALGGD
jgi:hypothetical protein